MHTYDQDIDFIYVTTITANSRGANYRYTARMKDGTERIVRNSSTRLYEHCFVYDGHVNGNGGDGSVQSYLLWGKKPTAFQRINLLKTFIVQRKPV